MRVTLNLATRPFTDLGPTLKRLRIAMGGLALLSVLLGLGLHALHSKAEAARARDHSLDGAIANVSRVRQGYLTMMREPTNARLLTQVAMLNKIFDEKAFSWTLTMESMETVLPGGVQVTAIEPIRDKDGHITLHLRVVGPHDLADKLVANLEHSRRFYEPRIVGETAESSGGPNQHLEPVSATNRFVFDLLAEYNPPTPKEEHAASKAPKKEPATHAASAGSPPRGPHRVPGIVPTKTARRPHAVPHRAVSAHQIPRRPEPTRPDPRRMRAVPSIPGGQQ